jgi:hypothetical protein
MGQGVWRERRIEIPACQTGSLYLFKDGDVQICEGWFASPLEFCIWVTGLPCYGALLEPLDTFVVAESEFQWHCGRQRYMRLGIKAVHVTFHVIDSISGSLKLGVLLYHTMPIYLCIHIQICTIPDLPGHHPFQSAGQLVIFPSQSHRFRSRQHPNPRISLFQPYPPFNQHHSHSSRSPPSPSPPS